MVGEALGGYLAHSLAILTDAAHLLTDFASIMISLFALWVSSRPPTKTMNFGWYRAEILGALLSVLSIWVVTGVLVYLGAQRLLSGDYDIEGGVMLITSACAVAVNIVMGVALHQTGHGHSHGAGGEQPNPSVRAAFVHVVGDLLQSVGVLIASYVIFFKPEYKFVDPICTFLFSALVLGTTLTILRDVLLVLMEGTPKGMDFNAVQETLLAVRGVEAVHSLHIWALTAAQPLLSVHIAISGYLAHSLAILTDAAHLLTDFASIMISLFALWVSSRPPTKTMNFGWYRAEILGALLSVLSIWVVTGVLVYLGAQRLLSGDYDIEGGVMLITSACAVAVNIVMGVALHQTGHGHSHGAGGEQPNPSVRAAFVHVVGDLLQSVGVLIASYVIFFKPEYKFVDPICTFLFSALVLGTTLTILRDVLLVLMEGTPKGMDFNAVQETLLAVRGVEAVHSLHIWALTAAQPLLSVHIAINAAASAQEVLEEASSRLQGAFRFHTTTIQVESYSEEMRDCRECQPPRD
ncbi:hypothetical protein HGM15179_011505 [Zosterops borbonicus]|uniref:Solute carrier family 30 member 2 n=1 Tax=Zosterops borbonicus TaxID=364589 RepID=A0A8K1LIV5_9PASS|nr:hypothetical protein HGM15179_011505 [Zosterops borbonicus]